MSKFAPNGIDTCIEALLYFFLAFGANSQGPDTSPGQQG